jgi:hypothetical protein
MVPFYLSNYYYIGERIVKNYYILAKLAVKGLFFIIMFYGGVHVWNQLEHDGQTLSSISIAVNKKTMSTLTGQMASDEKSIANLQHNEEIR